MRAVLDTNVVVSGTLWGGTPGRLIQAAVDGRLTLYTSPVLLTELQDVLTRDHLARRMAERQTDLQKIMALYARLCCIVSPLSAPRVVPDDIDDDQVIACAVAADAQLIVTGDRDLLVLHPWRGVRILNAAEAVEIIG